MRFNKLDLNLLVALDNMLEAKSVSRAAQNMNMTQSAMSNALARLRIYFDDALLVKVGRSMLLTPRAEALREAVRDVLVRVEWTVAATSDFDPAVSQREFNILVSDYTIATLVPELLKSAHGQAAKVRFNFLQQAYPPQNLLERGEADLLIIPKTLCSRDHPAEIILREQFCCIVWKDGKFGKRKLTREIFEAASHVVMKPPGGGSSLESLFIETYKVERRIEVKTFSFSSIPQLIAGTDRIATIHKSLALAAERELPLRIVSPPFPFPKMEQAMQWHKYRTQDPGLIWLKSMVRDAAAVAVPAP